MRINLLIISLLLLVLSLSAQDAKWGYALQYDGIDDYVTIPHDASFNQVRTTIELWFYWEAASGSATQFLLGKGFEQFEIHTGYENEASQIVPNALRFIPTTGVYFDTEANVIEMNKWHHLAFVYDPETGDGLYKGYIDGVEVPLTKRGANPSNTAIYTSEEPVFIGQRFGNAYRFKGKIDEVRIWNIVRTVSDIRSDIYRELVGNEPGLLAYYKMSNGNESSLTDNSENSNTGTLINGTAWVNSTVPDPMVLVYTVPDNTTIMLPLYGSVNVTVDWGDGNLQTITTTGNHAHTYANAGTYTVMILGEVTSFVSNTVPQTHLTSVISFGEVGLTNLIYAFYNAVNLTSVPARLPTRSTIVSLNSTFFGAKIFNGDISNWDVSGVTDMMMTFSNAEAFNQDISNWDMSKVTSMHAMFYNAKAFNQNIGGWNVGNVTSMYGVFMSATAFNQDIGDWNVSKVTTMSNMFAFASNFNQDLSNWDVSEVTNMYRMFISAPKFNSALLWGNKTAKVTNMMEMFRGASLFNQNIGGWNVGNVTTMEMMFYSANAFNQDISNWNVGSVTNMKEMFFYARKFNAAIGNWDVNKVTTMESMFLGCTEFNQDIGNWNVSKVTNMYSMFRDAKAFNWNINTKLVNEGEPGEYTAWDVSSVTNMALMFYNDISSDFNQPLDKWDVSKVTNMRFMFYRATSFNQNLAMWDVSKVTDMRSMFYGATSFNQNLAMWNVTNVTEMSSMFYGATSFNQNLAMWNVTNVTTMAKMLEGSGMNTINYNALLIGWSQLSGLKTAVTLSIGPRYTSSASEARSILTSAPNNWIITDGGLILDPTGISTTNSTPCQGAQITLTAQGTQGTVYWYTGSCGGTQIHTGNAINVSPTENTTYYARNYVSGTFSDQCASVEIVVQPILQYRTNDWFVYWETAQGWEQYNGVNWIPATTFPGEITNTCANPMVTIRSGHSVQIWDSVSIPNLTIENEGKLYINLGTGKLTVDHNMILHSRGRIEYVELGY